MMANKHRMTTYGNGAKSLKIPNTRIVTIPINNGIDIGIDILHVPTDDPNLPACWHKCLKGKVRRTTIAISKEGVSGNSLSKALTPLVNLTKTLTIVFVDEFDKLFISGNSNDSSAHESTTGVQNEFLKLLEGRITQVFGDYGKYIQVPLDKVLFIFAGAFNNEQDLTLDRLREIGVKTEFLGRVGLIYNTKPLTLEDLNKIVDNSDLLNKYCKLFNADYEEVSLYIKGYIAKFFDKNTLGARMINTLIQQYFIKGGVLNLEDAKEITFQKTLSLEVNTKE